MRDVGWLLAAILLAYGCAALAPLPRCSRRRARVGALFGWSCVALILACPALIPPARVGLRAASAFASGDLAFRLVDYFRQWDRLPPSVVLREYYRFLIPFPILSPIYPDHKRRLSRPEDPRPQVRHLVAGSLGFAVALAAVRALARTAPVRASFALNHAVVLITFVLAVESLSRVLCALERLAGFDTMPAIRNAYLSMTVAEFWRRYNRRIHDWLDRNVFTPTGGRRTPVRSTLLTFLVSGLFHELMFALATSRLTGYQLAFFTIQAPAVLASGRLERLARRGGVAGRYAAHTASLLFMALTSVLFFHGVGLIFPFLYSSQSPLP
jgi:hypothetical protein